MVPCSFLFAVADSSSPPRALKIHHSIYFGVLFQVKDGKINDLSTANTMLSNLPEEIRHYRDLQITVPLLQKENQKLRCEESLTFYRANAHPRQLVRGFHRWNLGFPDDWSLIGLLAF